MYRELSHYFPLRVVAVDKDHAGRHAECLHPVAAGFQPSKCIAVPYIIPLKIRYLWQPCPGPKVIPWANLQSWQNWSGTTCLPAYHKQITSLAPPDTTPLLAESCTLAILRIELILANPKNQPRIRRVSRDNHGKIPWLPVASRNGFDFILYPLSHPVPPTGSIHRRRHPVSVGVIVPFLYMAPRDVLRHSIRSPPLSDGVMSICSAYGREKVVPFPVYLCQPQTVTPLADKVIPVAVSVSSPTHHHFSRR